MKKGNLMKISKQRFLSELYNPERAFLVNKDIDGTYLIADMEIVDEFCARAPIRTERMDFLLHKKEIFLNEIVECRARYCGGIIIYDNLKKSIDTIFREFTEIANNAHYVYAKNNSVEEIVKELEYGMNYVLIN